jgi:hypothetical protein
MKTIPQNKENTPVLDAYEQEIETFLAWWTYEVRTPEDFAKKTEQWVVKNIYGKPVCK